MLRGVDVDRNESQVKDGSRERRGQTPTDKTLTIKRLLLQRRVTCPPLASRIPHLLTPSLILPHPTYLESHHNLIVELASGRSPDLGLA